MTWKPAVIVNKHWFPRSYFVKKESGKIVRRNERHIRKSSEHSAVDKKYYKPELTAVKDQSTVIRRVVF
jgi:hypothetical protein